ncbi:DUF1015 domain-containing protein [Gehongia tenuis]|uniref:DUF1015 domain-containing protein n=1 Tax=Gehongia tenuis TaxID=2763655 RepID=A0A926HQZ8_9FIRM|nr:DUF1015 domain-containing protein [Gehongia tenuis]MBC8532280.1 DUF1015 domain-containing protein [Gehongia tenuis]
MIYNGVAVKIPRLLMPIKGTELEKWAVVACDQYTAEEAYWREVEAIVKDAPSTLRLIYPEVYLERPDKPERIRAIHDAIKAYLDSGVLTELEPGMMLVRRTLGNKTRTGLVLSIDLEAYDFTPGSQSLIRATEGTIVDRLPPRIAIREAAPAEFPHVMLLVDDPGRTVIEPLWEGRGALKKTYDFELMMGGGHLEGYFLPEEGCMKVLDALEGLKKGEHPLLFASGDGNHSLATAKRCWENLKPALGDAWEDHPARFALVEVVNLHDEGLVFEPIHRVLFGVDARDLVMAMEAHFKGNLTFKDGDGGSLWAKLITPAGEKLARFRRGELAVGLLQDFLDDYLKRNPKVSLDYVHGDDVTEALGKKPGNAAFLLPPIDKNHLFEAVDSRGVLPRKTFSMGEAQEKRFYMEGRIIRP